MIYSFYNDRIREAVKTTKRIFSAKGVLPLPTPLAEDHFAKKTLAEMGGPPPPNIKYAKLLRIFFS